MKAKLIIGIAFLFGLFQFISVGPLLNLDIFAQRSIHLGFALALLFLMYPAKNEKLRFIDYALFLGSIVSCVYVMIQQSRFLSDPYTDYTADLILGTILIIAIIEGARRTVGIILPILSLVFIAYALFGNHIPGFWGYNGMSYERLINSLYKASSGIWGTTLAVSATIISIFVILGTVILKSGASDLIMDSVRKLTGKSTGGPPKLAVVSSSIFGSISGSSAANVAVTGSITIPLMKRLRDKPAFAGGTEAAASTGGQFLPPVMGSGAFVMAEFLKISYVAIMKAAIIPALLFYIGMYFTVHFHAVKNKLVGTDDFKKGWISILKIDALISFVGSFAIMFVMLFQGYSAAFAGFWAVVFAMAIYLVFGLGKLETLKKRFFDLLDALKDSGQQIVIIASLTGAAQIVIPLINSTGIGAKFSSLIISFGGTSLFLSLVMTMILCTILGMGMPAVAAYILTAAIAAQSLTEMGIEPIAAHMFIFYYSCLSAITPPVCAAVFVAAPMAGTKWLPTAIEAMKVGAIGFIIPFIFVYQPGYLMEEGWVQGIYVLVMGSMLVLTISSLLTGQFFSVSLNWLTRILMAAACFGLLLEGIVSNLVGIAVMAAIYVYYRYILPKTNIRTSS